MMMLQTFKNIIVYLVVVVSVIAGLLSTESKAASGKVLYEKSFLATNLHADRGNGKLSSVNYQVIGTLIKWGTPVKIVEINSVDDPNFRNEYKIIDLSKNVAFRFSFHGRTLKYQDPYQYFDSISTEDLDTLKSSIDQFAQIDKVGIDKGIVMEGMSRNGVLIALGVPPVFVNPSPGNSTTWHYWFNKRNRFKVLFDNEGKVNKISGKYPYRQQYVPDTSKKQEDLDIKEKQDNDFGIKEKLEKLKKLYEEKLITKEDYESKKAEILSEF